MKMYLNNRVTLAFGCGIALVAALFLLVLTACASAGGGPSEPSGIIIPEIDYTDRAKPPERPMPVGSLRFAPDLSVGNRIEIQLTTDELPGNFPLDPEYILYRSDGPNCTFAEIENRDICSGWKTWVEDEGEEYHPGKLDKNSPVNLGAAEDALVIGGTGATRTYFLVETTEGLVGTASLSTSMEKFSARYGHTAVVHTANTDFTEKIWLLGGDNADGTKYNDVWSSDDGMKWLEESSASEDAEYPKIHGHSSVVFNDAIWIIGGKIDGVDGYSSKVWSSSNGKDWVLEKETAEFPPRSKHTSVVYGDNIYVIGGNGDAGTYLNDVWSSDNGKDWVNVSDIYLDGGEIFSSRYAHTSLVHNAHIWVIGGVNADATKANDVWKWSPTTEAGWSRATPPDGVEHFLPRSDHASITYKNRMWVLAGKSERESYADVWSSDNGETWRKEEATMPFDPHRDSVLVEFNSAMWVLGGIRDDNSVINNVWSSIDGKNWKDESQSWFRDHREIPLMPPN